MASPSLQSVPEPTQPARMVPEARFVSATPRLASMNLTVLALLIYFSWGTYIPFWFARRGLALNSLRSKVKLSPIAVGMILVLIAVEVAALRARVGQILVLGIVGTWLLQIFCTFRVKKIMENHLSNILGKTYRLSGTGAFFLGPIYLQWKINNILAGRL